MSGDAPEPSAPGPSAADRAVAADPFDLARFVQAQESCHAQALRELQAGAKRSHWMWFVFPQVEGLGHSPTARRYAIASLAEARAYLEHPLLGPRLLACTQAVNRHRGRSARQIFGPPDDLKFHSSMTLFALAAGPDSAFATALDRFFAGARDPRTHERLGIA